MIPMARGSNAFWVWSLGQGTFESGNLNDNLSLRIDPDRPANHGFVEPAHTMLLIEYRKYLEATQNQWQIDENDE